MKSKFRLFVLMGLIMILPGLSSLSQVSINTTGDPPVSSAMLDIKSTTGGLLIPRMTQGEMTSINNPANGLQVFCTTDNKLYIFLSSINRWKEIEFGVGELLLPATYSIGGGSSCMNTVVKGTYTPDVPLTFSSFITIQVDVSTTGTYSVTTNTVNGYSFSASGEFSITGTQTINLMGSGTPAIAQTDQFTATASNNGGTCTFDILVWVSCPGLPTIIYGDQTYNTIQIGTQCWLKENLNLGTSINSSIGQTNNSIIEKYCYDNLEANCGVYGGLYQWAEVVQYLNGATNTTSWSPVPTGNIQGICPAGWHVPKTAEFTVLRDYLGGEYAAGGKMKTIGTIQAGTGLWWEPNIGATNSSGFTGLPGGFWYNNFGYYPYAGYFWHATEGSPTYGNLSYLYTINNHLYIVGNYKIHALSVRCLKD